ncbi:MAG: hypothetical protein ACK40O_00575 [Allosphingosinicella sp.]
MAEEQASGIAASGDPARFAEAHRQLVADGAIQLDLQRFQPKPPPAWLKRLFEMLEGTGPVFTALFWILLAIGVLLLVYHLLRFLEAKGVFGGRGGGEDDGAQWRPQEAPARALLEEADRLAAAGRYSEAAHLLLYRSIEDIDDRRPDLVRPALTSRDIAGAPALPAGPRAAFSRIVLLVERSLFGGRALDGGDWVACRAAYEAFAFADEWGGR